MRHKWIFTVKPKTNEARLVVKGYTQTYGINYEEIFSRVANMNIV